jgi:type II secretion system protein H
VRTGSRAARGAMPISARGISRVIGEKVTTCISPGISHYETSAAGRRASLGGSTTRSFGRRCAFHRAHVAGFTLLEILVVIAILAIAAGIAVATLDRDERGALDREARRFAGALEYAARRAELRHETLGVSAADGQWRFWLRTAEGRWRTLSEDEPLAPRVLPESFSAAPLTYAGQPLTSQAIVPLRPSGRNEPYSFVLASPTLEAIVSADPMNRVAVTGPQPLAR